MCISPRAGRFEYKQPLPFPEEPELQAQVNATSALPASQGEKGKTNRSFQEKNAKSFFLMLRVHLAAP